MTIKRIFEEYYNKETETLTVINDYNSLLKDLPLEIKIIIFKDNHNSSYSKFNQKVNNLLDSITFDFLFNQQINIFPSSLTHDNIWMQF